MIRRPPRSTQSRSSAASDVYKRQEAGGEIGRFDRDRQAPLETIAQPRLQGRELAGQPVCREDELAAALVESVEGVEELLFGVLLALQELDVVDKQDIEIAVAALEMLSPARAQSADELVGEALGGRVADAEAGSVGAQVVGCL